MKKLLVVSAVAALGLSAVAFAGGLPEEMPAAPAAVVSSDMGPYIGIEGGYGMTHYKNWSENYSVGKDNGIVGRAFLGYDINKYFAAEFGYSYFFNKAKKESKSNSNNYTEYKTQAFDLFGKGKLPVTDEFGLYAKLGVGYLMTNAKDNGTWTGTKSPKNFNVAYGAGADYYITSNVIANVEWLRYNGNSIMNSDNYQPNTDAFMIGLRYRFDV